jgi:toxin ParE1/3/4
MGRILPDFYLSFIREVFVGRYRLVYSIQEQTLKVLAVRPMGQPLGKL